MWKRKQDNGFRIHDVTKYYSICRVHFPLRICLCWSLAKIKISIPISSLSICNLICVCAPNLLFFFCCSFLLFPLPIYLGDIHSVSNVVYVHSIFRLIRRNRPNIIQIRRRHPCIVGNPIDALLFICYFSSILMITFSMLTKHIGWQRFDDGKSILACFSSPKWNREQIEREREKNKQARNLCIKCQNMGIVDE